MADYTVRVELRDANSEDYELLHEKMGAKGYSREIQGDSGEYFQLPPAEYVATKDLTAIQVREEVRAIANSIKNNRILVTQSEGRTWYLDQL
ncbi:hypothetical protein [Enterobacter asburiae]|uniref:hypothetical protein n=1 Tax=Enterobacter asburiae TaxID=61645 RepID=UPI003BEBAECA